MAEMLIAIEDSWLDELGRPTIITPMASDPSLSWTSRTVLRPDRDDPYLCIQDIIVFVRDLDRSMRFYVNQLGFELIVDHRPTSGEHRWIEVAPPDGSANLTLVVPRPDRPEYNLIGVDRHVLFMTEDVHAKYKEWSERGVHFLFPPRTQTGARSLRGSKIRTGIRLDWKDSMR